MLSLKNITKDYPAGNTTVHALKGVSLDFRKSEFVSILGPSGCGKTTMLNIIGGLDRYTDGDLIIGGVSTEKFKARDWDAYRNHSIGFVFQSYNLIPHQTVLQNVELALTLSGVSKSERRKRAKEALDKVGLSDQLTKKPSEMSGGQMQRVAIARAIVNDPDIILADEPTGALDTKTSVQVMEILKDISKERLVIMVTHNPELADTYSTRIIRMLDGVITDDSMPLSEEELKELYTKDEEKPEKDKKKVKKPSMSIFTAFGLSLKNLFTKKGRTLLTSFAGSIGIIGIALIFAVSQGMTTYIDTVQEETLSSYPLTLESTHIDLGTLLETFMGSAESHGEHEKDAVYEKSMIYDMINSLSTLEETENDLSSFKKYIEERMADENDTSGLKDAISGVQYGYNLNPIVYTENVDGNILKSDTSEITRSLIADYMGMNFSKDNMKTTSSSSSSPMASLMTSNSSGRSLWQEMLPGKNGSTLNDVFYNQYDVIYGDWPSDYNEIVLVLDENNELDDITLYALGLMPEETINSIMDAAKSGNSIDADIKKWSYEEICAMEYRIVMPSDCYTLDETSGLYTDLRDTQAGLKYLYTNGTSVKVKGIIRPKPDVTATILTGNIGYTSKLTEYVIEKSSESPATKAQLDTPNTDIFSGLPFKDTTSTLNEKTKADYYKNYAEGLSEAEKAAAYIKIKSIPPEDAMNEAVDNIVSKMSREDMEKAMLTALTTQMNMKEDAVEDYLKSMSDEDLTDLIKEATKESYKMQYASGVAAQLSMMSPMQLAFAFDGEINNADEAALASYYDTLEFSDSSYEDNLVKLGKLDLTDPATINIYASSFENKDIIKDAIDAYNDSVDDLHKIAYTDYVGIMMSSITTIINAITYVLIAFVAISLIVSSIMIGVITLISVQERTKEIGILRAIGASKRNVSSMFNAETVIIGFTSGLLGIVLTYLLCLPINAILHSLTGINNLSAILPIEPAIILIVISMLLTLIAGIIPSRSAAKKDPVVALRTE